MSQHPLPRMTGVSDYVRNPTGVRPTPGCDYDPDCTGTVVHEERGMRYCDTHRPKPRGWQPGQLGPAYGGRA